MAADPGFIHLRVHTAYSLSEGAIRISDLARLCRERNMPAVAITDTDNLFGGMEASVSLAKAGLQPIIGCQLSILRDGPAGAGERGRTVTDPMVVLVQGEAGYRNLLHLIALSQEETRRSGAPGLPLGVLADHAGELIALTGGPAGPVGRLLQAGQTDTAAALLERLAAAFPGRLYLEILRHGLAAEAATEPAFLALAGRLGLPIVATNEVFFASPEMYEAHDALICIAEGVHVADAERRHLSPEHHFKSAAEMAGRFADLPDALANTVHIARRCAFMIEPVRPILPSFEPASGLSEEDQLRRQARDGLELRLERHVFTAGLDDPARGERRRAYGERLEHELDVICRMGFAGYFLIVAEFIQWARGQGIPVGPGRGSGAGSLVAWSLTITDLDPLRFGLLFERFLNPERVSMPDFDIDFCQDRRDEVIHHVQERYGADRVAQIITFGKLQARAVLRDVGRVLGMAYGHVDKICKLVPNNPAKPVTLKQAIEGEPQLQAMIAGDENVARLVDVAGRLEGLYRHASTHAAGVVIGDRPLWELIPLYVDPRSSMPVTGFNMKWVESSGLVKFDFLGLKTLTVLSEAVRRVAESEGETIDLSALPLDDRKTFEMLGRGDTVGVFQLESSGMRDVLRRLKPDTVEDVIAVVALYRPGPMDNIPSFIRRKHGEEPVDTIHPMLGDILKETYGIIVYQEQVMQIAQVLAGYSLGAADLLRRAMGKKIQQEMDKQRQTFVDGAIARGVEPGKASHIFDLVAKFAGYGFNKSHAAAYALIAYQTAWMKANYPVAFFAALMTLDIDHPDKLAGFRRELDRLAIPLLPPDINASDVTFGVETTAAEAGTPARSIRYGLAAVKNVGGAAMAEIVAERRRAGPFASVLDFAGRIDPTHLNRRQLENLARAGAFDRLEPNRRRIVEGVEVILRHAGAVAEDRNSGQIGLFGQHAGAAELGPTLPDVEDWLPMQRLTEEFDALGMYLSAHPLKTYERVLRRLNVVPFADVVRTAQAGGRPDLVVMAGTVMSRKERTSSRGGRYAFVELSDASGSFEVMVFSETLSGCRDLLEPGSPLLLRVAVQVEAESPRLTAQSVEALDAVASRTPVTLLLSVGGAECLPAVREVLTASGTGPGRVRLVSWIESGREVEVALPGRYAVGPETVSRLRRLGGVFDARVV